MSKLRWCSWAIPILTLTGNAGQCVQNKARLDITRLQRLSSGLGSFTTDGIRSSQPGVATPALDTTSKELLRMIFDKDGSYLQVSLLYFHNSNSMSV